MPLTQWYLCSSSVLKLLAMESELTTFLTTIDTPEFRRNNMAKVRAKAAAAQVSSGSLLSVPLAVAESSSLPLPTTHLQAAVSGK